MESTRIYKLTNEEFLGIRHTLLFAELIQRKFRVSASDTIIKKYINLLEGSLKNPWYCSIELPYNYNINNRHVTIYVSTDSDLERLNTINEGN